MDAFQNWASLITPCRTCCSSVYFIVFWWIVKVGLAGLIWVDKLKRTCQFPVIFSVVYFIVFCWKLTGPLTRQRGLTQKTLWNYFAHLLPFLFCLIQLHTHRQTLQKKQRQTRADCDSISARMARAIFRWCLWTRFGFVIMKAIPEQHAFQKLRMQRLI